MWKKIIGFGLILVLIISSAFVTPLANDTIENKENRTYEDLRSTEKL